MSQNPGYGQHYGQPPAAPGYDQRQQPPPGNRQLAPAEFGQPGNVFIPPARPAANYKGFNAYHCFGTILEGAVRATYTEISICICDIVLGIWSIAGYFVNTTIESLFIGHMVSIGLAVVNLIFSCVVLKTLLATGCRGVCGPIAWTSVICMRILLSLYLLVIVVLVFTGSTATDPVIIEYIHTLLVLTIVVAVLGILIYSYFIAIMIGFIRYKLASSDDPNGEDSDDAAVPITDYNPNSIPNGEVE